MGSPFEIGGRFAAELLSAASLVGMGRLLVLLPVLAAVVASGCKGSDDERPPLRSKALPSFQDSLVSYACPYGLSRRDQLWGRRRYRGWLRALRRAYRRDPTRTIRARRELSDGDKSFVIRNVTLRDLVDDYVEFAKHHQPEKPCTRRFLREMEALQSE